MQVDKKQFDDVGLTLNVMKTKIVNFEGGILFLKEFQIGQIIA